MQAFSDQFRRYYQAVNFLEGLVNLPLAGDFMVDRDKPEIYLKRMRYFLDLIGRPDRDLKFIHIAGTSGKGTVTAMVHEIINQTGLTVGSFSSPAVTTSIEKIKVGKQYIAPSEFVDIVEYLKPFIDQAYLTGPYGRPSYFELFLAIALVYFKQSNCDWVVLEVGLGGRYDATNIIANPIVTAITNIDYDHTEVLGKTLEKIANDKAGIIKSDSVFFTTEQKPALVKIFKNICIDKKAVFNQLPRQKDYQSGNQMLATAIVKQLNISDNNIVSGLKQVRLPGRFEIVSQKPLVVLDGAHNRSKISSVVFNLKRLRFNKLYLVVGIADNKDHVTILKQIVPLADRVFFTRFGAKSRQATHPKKLLVKSKSYLKAGTKPRVYLDSNMALGQALQEARPNDLVLVTGSFLLVGELRQSFVSEEFVLKNLQSFQNLTF